MKKVIYKKRPAPWNWGAFDEIGIICAAPTKKECQQKLSSMRKNGRYNINNNKNNTAIKKYTTRQLKELVKTGTSISIFI